MWWLVKFFGLAVSFTTLAWLSFKWLQARRYVDLPGPPWYLSLPFIGHAYLLGKNPCKKTIELSRKYGPIFRLDLGKMPTVFLTSRVKNANSTYIFKLFISLT
jgi:hypothetical protein